MTTATALHAALLRSDSATAVLERLCGSAVTIRRVAGARLPPRCLADDAATVHRSVQLLCDAQVLSAADLWFRPGLLPPGIVATLAVADTPFGRVVQHLGLRRRTLSARICAPGEPYALEHHAVLADAAGALVAEVTERYCWGFVAGI